MELSHYIHYYIGCRIEKDSDALDYPIIEGIDRNNVIVSTYRYKTPHSDLIFVRPRIWKNISSIKPILRNRNLLDMTKEEEDELKAIKGTSIIYRSEPPIEITYDTPETFHWMLKKQFDLFELIENGLAIDSKTLK